jgi:hypothetical protein
MEQRGRKDRSSQTKWQKDSGQLLQGGGANKRKLKTIILTYFLSKIWKIHQISSNSERNRQEECDKFVLYNFIR